MFVLLPRVTNLFPCASHFQQEVSSEDVAILIKLQKRVKELEAVKKKLTRELDKRDDDKMDRAGSWAEDAFESLKVESLGEITCS